MADLKVCVVGASGYMGLELIKASAARDGVVLVAAVERSGSDAIGKDATALAGLAPQD
ncbi:MAG: 4-hydroxy-tetrahydrodipicolinate reductase, partial [Pseudomonadota bacterium]